MVYSLMVRTIHLLCRRCAIGGLAFIVVFVSGCAVSPGSQPREEAPAQRARLAPLEPDQQQLVEAARQATETDQWSLAETNLEAVIKERPDIGWLKSRLAWIKQRQGAPDRAVALYRDALSTAPDDVLALNNLALLLQERGDFQEAGEVLRSGLERAPDVAELHFNFAVLCELYLLDLSTALEHYRRYQQLTGVEDERIAGWIADLERRVN